MKLTSLLFLFLLLITNCTTPMNNDFSPYPRVRQAYSEKIDNIQQLLSKQNIDTASLNIFIRAFKTEKLLEIWAKNATDEKYQLVHTYDVCKSSGDLGPKRKEGDYQVPEGFCPFFLI